MADYTIKNSAVKVVKQRLICSCGKEMHHTGIVLTSIPAQYPHKCEAGHMTVVPHPTTAYPCINFVDAPVQYDELELKD